MSRTIQSLTPRDRVVPKLSKIGLLSEVDQAALVSYCVAVANVRRTTQALDAGASETFKTEKGYIGKHPVVTRQTAAIQTVLKFAQEFGLTPAARDRLGITPVAPSSGPGGVIEYAQSKGT